MMSRIPRLKGHQRERGAVAITIAIVMFVLMAAAALGFDIAKLAYERQALRAAVDAAAQAGSYALNDAAKAESDAKAFALASAPDLNLDPNKVVVTFYCAVGVKAGTSGPDESQVPYVCDPGSKWVKGTPAEACNESMCLLPCDKNKAISPLCNTIKVSYEKVVDFVFAPAIGIDTGTTGAVSSASCKGMCGGSAPPNPLDVVVIADRTPSMRSTDDVWLKAMKTGITGMLGTMNEKQQYVAFGAIHKSVSSPTCLTANPASGSYLYKGSFDTDKAAGTLGSDLKEFAGKWVPVDFTEKYTVTSATGVVTADTTTDIYKAINGSGCLGYSTQTLKKPDYVKESWTTKATGTNTHLASALKGAARYLLGKDANNLGSLSDRTEYGEPEQVIIFETDGQPAEVINSGAAALSLDNPYDIGAAGDGQQGCKNFLKIADLAKEKHIRIITIGFGSVNTQRCGGSGSDRARDALAAAATEESPGVASVANSDCSSPEERTTENTDKDWYFCAATGDDLKSIFAAAMGKTNKNTKFIKVPGVSD